MRVEGNTVYGDFFEVLRAWPAAGRLLSASETTLDADPRQAVISQRLAGQLFGSVVAAVGKTVRMNDAPVGVVGVVGGGFAGPERGIPMDAWLPYGALVPLVDFTPETLVDRGSTMHGDIIVRPRPGVSPAAVRDQAAEILDRLKRAGNESGPYLAKLSPSVFEGLNVPPIVRHRTFATLRLLAIAVALVLLIACANVANLLLFRNVQRRGTVATLRALGASTGRVARQQLVLSLLLGLVGTLAGVGVGWLLALPFRGAQLARMPAFEGLVLDVRVGLFAGVACVATAILFGTLPAVLAGRFDLAGSLRSASGRDTGRLARLRSALAAGQLALGLALVVAAILLVRTMHNLHAVDMGLETDGVAALTVNLPRGLQPGDQDLLFRNLLGAAQATADVQGVAADPYGPYGPGFIGRVSLPDAPADARVRAHMLPVTPGWFELLHVRPVSGRTFRDGDWSPGAPGRAILTESLARRLFGTTEAAGRTVDAGFAQPEPMEVVGVVRDIRSPFAPDRPEDTFFVTPAKGPSGLPMLTLLLRVSGLDPGLAGRIRTAVEGVLPDEPVEDPSLLSGRLDDINEETRIYSRLLALLSGLAVILSAVGLYGVMGFTVAARRREFGVRMALGAGSGRIGRLVAGNAGAIVAAGTVLGLGSSWVLSRLLRHRLFGVDPLDPASWGLAAAVFAAVAAMACWAPTRRAVRVDPVTTLRED